jgi:hypothetical protein
LPDVGGTVDAVAGFVDDGLGEEPLEVLGDGVVVEVPEIDVAGVGLVAPDEPVAAVPDGVGLGVEVAA